MGNHTQDMSVPLEQLGQSTLFKGVDLDPLEHWLHRGRVVDLNEGDELIGLGVQDDSLYVVLEGKLGVHVSRPGDEPIAVVGPGDSVGEIAALDRKPRSAAVVAQSRARVFQIQRSDFWHLMGSSHRLALNMLYVLSERLRGNNAKIVDTRRLQEQYRRTASLDALTGLYNRRGLSELAERLMKRLEIKQAPLSLVMVDVDHFKRFNDEHGHPAGDFVLFAVAQVLKSRLRPTDFVARYGGEEFTILLPETDAFGAEVAANRVRAAIGETDLCMPDGTKLPSVTASMGVAQHRSGESLEELIRRADEALYVAKRGGRDRVELASDEVASGKIVSDNQSRPEAVNSAR